MSDSQQLSRSEQTDSGGWSDMGGTARKFHFFAKREHGEISLCGKWLLMHPERQRFSPEVADSPSKLDCVVCRRKVEKLLGTRS